MLLFLAILAADSVSPPPMPEIFVPRQALDCYLSRVRPTAGKRSPQQVFYLDLRGCPPPRIIRAQRRFNSFPSFERPLPPVEAFPDFRSIEPDGTPVDRVLVVTGAELNCLDDRRKLDRIRTAVSPRRYRLRFGLCS